MSFSIGIIGLPNVGKSTLFKALTKQPVDISNYPFTTIEPNVGIVRVPDKRLLKIAAVVESTKITPTVIEFIDIAGLVKNAHQGEGLGNQFLARLRETDAICHLVRAFEDEKIVHLEGKTNPQRDIEIVNTELMLKDLETIEKRLEKVQKEAKSNNKETIQELDALNKTKKILEQGKIPDEALEAGTLTLLTAKPMVYVFNIDRFGAAPIEQFSNQELLHWSCSKLNLKLNLQHEAELSELTPEEQKELELPASKLETLIQACYQALNLITFYTVAGGNETRAWTLKMGLKAPQAGGKVHTDFEKKFIRAEVINWQKLVEAGAWAKAREKGLLKTERKEYAVQDGDVIEFKI